MLKLWSLKLNIFIKKGIVRFYPWAVKGRERVNWRKVGKVSLALLAYPALTFLFIFTGFEMAARFLISPFSPTDKAHIWFFFAVAPAPIWIPLGATIMYWLPKFLTSRFAVPLLKATLLTLLLSPFVYLFFIFAEYILAAIFAVLWFFSEQPNGPTEDELNHDHGDPWNDPNHPDYLMHN